MVVPNCCNTPAWCHNAGGPKSRDTGTARLWSQKSWWCGCLRPPIIVTVNSLLLGEWLNAFHSKVGYEWHHFLGWTSINVMLMSKIFHGGNIFGLFMVAQSGLRMATDGPGSWQEWKKEEWSPSSLLAKQCCSVAVLPSFLLAKQCCSVAILSPCQAVLQCCSVAILSPCQASKVKAFSQKARAYSVRPFCEKDSTLHSVLTVSLPFWWAQDSSPRIQKHEERLKRRKNILELSHLIENYICHCFIACHWSDSSGTGLITSENTTIDCC